MNRKRIFAWLLASTMVFSVISANYNIIPSVTAAEIEEPDEEPDDDLDDDPDDETEQDAVAGAVTNVTAVYDEATATITLTYTKTGCDYVDISISVGDSELSDVEKYNLDSYVYHVMDFGKTYSFEVTPYNNAEDPEPVESALVEVTCEVPDNNSLLKGIAVSYDMATNTLQIDWVGTNISSVDIYQDGTKIATVTNNNSYSTEVILEEAKSYQYMVTAYGADTTESQSRTYELVLGRYPAHISNVNAEYNNETKQIQLTWDSTYTTAVDILINDTEIIKGYTQSQYNINYKVQPGAKYTIYLIPYNINGEAGDTVEASVSDGEFILPDAPDLEQQCEPILNKKGIPTGFYRPAIDVTIDVQPGAVYEIYRATSDKKSAYSWLATVTAGEEDTYTYRDTKVEVKTYYYKVLRKITEDDYISDETYTGLSDSSELEVEIPEPEITGKLLEDGRIEILLETDSDIVFGYEIYRKTGSGKYQLLTTISGNSYKDANVSFDTRYSYKAKAYYYDTKTKTKAYGPYSSVFSVRNTIGDISIDVTPLSGNQVEISWTKAGNAEGYEVYCKTNTMGDSYELITNTKKLSTKKKLKNKKVYSFLVKAYRKSSKGKTYFSEAEIIYKTSFTKPTGLTITNTSYRVVQNTLIQQTNLKWNRVYDAKGYYIEYLDSETGKYTMAKKLKGGSTTSCTITERVPANTSTTDIPVAISYRVVAYKGSKTLASEPIEIPLQLNTPTNVKAKASGTSVHVSWKKVTSAEKYYVYRSCGRGKIFLGETTKPSITDKNIEMGITYSYYIQAVNQTLGYESEFSEPVEYTYIPSPVKKLRAASKTGRNVVLKWNKVKNADSYVIYCSTQKNGDYKKLATVKSSVQQYTHKNLVRWRTYYYKIVTVKNNSAGSCAESKPAKTNITVVR